MSRRRTASTLASLPLLPAWPAQAEAASERSLPAVVELRSYRTRPGRREELIEMFEAHFLDAYESAGARILATTRQLDEPDRWVWIRAFDSLAAREAALRGFYTSAAWRERAAACNATLLDTRDAWLLTPEPAQPPWPGPVPAAAAAPATLVELRLQRLGALAAADAQGLPRERLLPMLAPPGAPGAWSLRTLKAPAEGRQQPLRAGRWWVSLVRFDSAAAHEAQARLRAESPDWAAVARDQARLGWPPAASWRLQPTPRSALR